MSVYKVEIKNSGGTRFRVRAEGYEFDIDSKGGGCPPPSALLAGLGSCIGVYLRKYAEGAKMELPEFTVTAEGELEGPAPFAFRKINIRVDFRGAAMDDRRKKSILAFIRNCPVHHTLKTPPEINIDL